jgi:hypothetical protein
MALAASAAAALRGGGALRACLGALSAAAPRAAAACGAALLQAAAPAPAAPLLPPCRGFTSGPDGAGQKHSAIYITDAVGSTQQEHTPLILGLLNYFERHLPRVGYFTPLGGSPRGAAHPTDAHVKLVQSVFGGDLRWGRGRGRVRGDRAAAPPAWRAS